MPSETWRPDAVVGTSASTGASIWDGSSACWASAGPAATPREAVARIARPIVSMSLLLDGTGSDPRRGGPTGAVRGTVTAPGVAVGRMLRDVPHGRLWRRRRSPEWPCGVARKREAPALAARSHAFGPRGVGPRCPDGGDRCEGEGVGD